MSLECETGGTVCDECDHFDFLPTQCLTCGRMFCAEHLPHHHRREEVGAAESTPAFSASPGRWCGPGDSSWMQTSEPAASASAACSSSFCIRLPEDELLRKVLRPSEPAAPQLSAGDQSRGMPQRRAPRGQSKGEVSVLAPQGQLSRSETQLHVAALFPRRDTDQSWIVEGRRFAVAPGLSLGQMMERSLGAVGGSFAYSSPASLWVISTHASSSHSSSLGSSSVPLLRFTRQPSVAVVRDVLQPGAVVLICPQGAARAETEAEVDNELDTNLRTAVSGCLFSSCVAAVEQRPRWAAAVAARLRLRSFAQPRQLDTGQDPAKTFVTPVEVSFKSLFDALPERCTIKEDTQTKEEKNAGAHGVAATPPQGASPVFDSPATSPEKTVEESTGAPRWPFRRAPPLFEFSFANVKSTPRGAEGAAASGGGVRVVVAVFVEDAVLPVTVQPFCLAARTTWSWARLRDRAVKEAAAAARLPVSAFARYTLFELNEKATSSEQGGEREGVKSSAEAGLSNGQVFLLGQPDQRTEEGEHATKSLCPNARTPQMNRAVLAELVRMRDLKGREATRMRMERLKKCVLL